MISVIIKTYYNTRIQQSQEKIIIKQQGVGVLMLCWTLTLCATGCAAFVLPRLGRLCFATLHRRPFAATLHFAPPEVQARRLLQDYVVTHRTLAPAGTENTTHGTPFGEEVRRLLSSLSDFCLSGVI